MTSLQRKDLQNKKDNGQEITGKVLLLQNQRCKH